MMDLQYPIGRVALPETITMEHIQQCIRDIEEAPKLIQAAVAGLTEEQLDTPYRPEGWTVRQLVHHLPDSHMNTYLNFKLALTEDAPAQRSGNVDAWAKLGDSTMLDIGMSLVLLSALHQRWVGLMQAMKEEDFYRTVVSHVRGPIPLAVLLCIYAWHGKHHAAHITSLRTRMSW